MLFNIDSKSHSREDKDAIVKIFQRVFNSLRGYCDNQYFFIADLERKLDEQGKYEEFKTEFEKLTQNTWEDQRDDFYLISDDIVDTLVNIGFLSEDGARNWVDKAEDNYEVSIEELTKQINDYCEKKTETIAVKSVTSATPTNPASTLNANPAAPRRHYVWIHVLKITMRFPKRIVWAAWKTDISNPVL